MKIQGLCEETLKLIYLIFDSSTFLKIYFRNFIFLLQTKTKAKIKFWILKMLNIEIDFCPRFNLVLLINQIVTQSF